MATKDVRRNPLPPFTTSTMQQDASSRLGFSPSSTMQLAQQLYEGSASSQGERPFRPSRYFPGSDEPQCHRCG